MSELHEGGRLRVKLGALPKGSRELLLYLGACVAFASVVCGFVRPIGPSGRPSPFTAVCRIISSV